MSRSPKRRQTTYLKPSPAADGGVEAVALGNNYPVMVIPLVILVVGVSVVGQPPRPDVLVRHGATGPLPRLPLATDYNSRARGIALK